MIERYTGTSEVHFTAFCCLLQGRCQLVQSLVFIQGHGVETFLQSHFDSPEQRALLSRAAQLDDAQRIAGEVDSRGPFLPRSEHDFRSSIR